MALKPLTRFERLAGTDDWKRGGGLPLPPLFHAIAAELLDRGESSAEDLIRPVEEELGFKRERVNLLYPDTGFAGLVIDGLEQLAAAKFVEVVDGRWGLTEKFRSRIGKPITVISKGKATRTGVKIVVHSKADRERLGAAASEEARAAMDAWEARQKAGGKTGSLITPRTETRQERWRRRNADRYRTLRRGYMREYMRAYRAKRTPAPAAP